MFLDFTSCHLFKRNLNKHLQKCLINHLYFQAAQQLIIISNTGQFRWSIIISIVVSLLSLSWGASRTFFMERSEDEADPDPDALMVVLRVFPCMILMVGNSLLMWVLLGGFLGLLVFLVLKINFWSNFTTVKCFTIKVDKERNKCEENTERERTITGSEKFVVELETIDKSSPALVDKDEETTESIERERTGRIRGSEMAKFEDVVELDFIDESDTESKGEEPREEPTEATTHKLSREVTEGDSVAKISVLRE